ncbi:universal stress protein [Vibrio salilacus]|uniref:universal stress protein n=1 Tax=Vibrio salilacus TaxID=1323749 RepID=UPI000C2A919A|nr:universal stress protein [Vibrio salilacus]
MSMFKHMLFIYNDDNEQETSLANALQLASHSQAKLTIIYVLEKNNSAQNLDDIEHSILCFKRDKIGKLCNKLPFVIPPTVLLSVGKLYLEVIRTILASDIDLVIKKADNPHWTDRLFGSNDIHLLRKCPCPLLLMKPNDSIHYKNILAAVDFGLFDKESHINEQICSLAFNLSIAEFAQLHIANAWEIPYAGFASVWLDSSTNVENKMQQEEKANSYSQINNILDKLEITFGDTSINYLKPLVHLPKGNAVEVLPKLITSLNIDLVVMGTLSRTGISGMLIGNTSEEIINQLSCSILAVKPVGFISPV